MFDHDAPFDEAGLAVLADSVVGFEDVLAAVHEDTGRFTNLDRLVKRIEQQDAALEKRLAEEPPQMAMTQDIAAAPPAPPPPAPPPPPEAPPRLSLESLMPGRGSAVAPERDLHGVLPKAPPASRYRGQAAVPRIDGGACASRRQELHRGDRRRAATTMIRKSLRSSAKKRPSFSKPPTRRLAHCKPSVAAATRSPNFSACFTR